MRIYAEMNNAQLVTTAVKLDQSQKEYKSKLDAVKAELQGRGLRIIEDRNVKFIKFFLRMEMFLSWIVSRLMF